MSALERKADMLTLVQEKLFCFHEEMNMQFQAPYIHTDIRSLGSGPAYDRGGAKLKRRTKPHDFIDGCNRENRR